MTVTAPIRRYDDDREWLYDPAKPAVAMFHGGNRKL